LKRKIEYHFEFTGTASEIDAVLFFKKLLTPTLRNSLKYTYREEEMAMMTVNEVSKLTGVSIRTLQYYDTIGLLKPIQYTESGYRLYDDTSLERLQQILLFKELEFPLREIKWIIDAPNYDRNKALEQQIELLTMKKEHLENLINFARGIKGIGVKYMDFKVFDTRKIDEYTKRAKEQWGQTAEYKEFEEKTKNWTKDDEAAVANEFMQIFVEFGKMKEMNPADEPVQLQVRKLQDYITEHFYTCSDKVLCGLGRMYAGGGELTENIDAVCGAGTAEFASKAIDIYYMSRR
jgi:DNA-binding transcriptional MerR regulator